MGKISVFVVIMLMIGGSMVGITHQDQGGDLKSMGYRVYSFNQRTKEDISNEQGTNILQYALDTLDNAKEQLRLYIDEERLSAIYETEAFYEITYDEPTTVKLGSFGQRQAAKVLIPLTGDFAPLQEGKLITILILPDDGEWEVWLCTAK